MGIVLNPESAYAKELARWNTPRNQFVKNPDGTSSDVRGMGAIGIEPFPRMVYKAHKRENGKVMCGDNPMMYRDERLQLEAEAFSRSCQLIVRSEGEYARALSDGWRDTPNAALEHYEALEHEIFTAAAEAAHAASRMSEKARAEFDAADKTTHEQVTDVKGSKRGPKAVTAQGD